MPSNYTCYVRILHAVPNAPPVDIYVNDVLVQSNLKYEDFTDYKEAKPGVYNIQARLANDPQVILLSQDYQIEDGWIYTLAYSGLERRVTSDLIGDGRKTYDKAKAHIRFINLSPSQTKYDIYMNDKLIIDNLGYRMMSVYYPEIQADYRFRAVDSVTGQTKLVHPSISLKDGKNYAGYIVGLDDAPPGLDILIPLEGSSYLPLR